MLFTVNGTELKLREAQVSDRQGVIDINRGIYGGCDYVPMAFTHWMSKPNQHKCFVVTEQAKIVAFTAYSYYQHNDKTIYVQQGSRVRSDYSGLGVNGILSQFVKDEIEATSTRPYVVLSVTMLYFKWLGVEKDSMLLSKTAMYAQGSDNRRVLSTDLFLGEES